MGNVLKIEAEEYGNKEVMDMELQRSTALTLAVMNRW
jgi:hypothetical protein